MAAPSQHSTTRGKYIKGQVLVSPYYSENELTDNKCLANFLADKLKIKVYLLPRLEQTTEVGRRLRCKLLPRDVKEGKNPDYMINGLLFDGKSMYGLKKDANMKEQHTAITNHIKKAKRLADNIVLEIPSFVGREMIHWTVNGYLSQSRKERIIMVHWKNKLLVYRSKTKR